MQAPTLRFLPYLNAILIICRMASPKHTGTFDKHCFHSIVYPDLGMASL